MSKGTNIESMKSVRDFVESLDGAPDEFSTKLNVLVSGKNEYLFKNVYFHTYYDARYTQFVVEILWEDDEDKPEYHSLGLHGFYNTNYQAFSYSNGNLVFYDGDTKISAFGS